MKIEKSKLIKGSGVLVVIFSALATSIYMISTFADYEHFNTSVEKYKSNLVSIYEEKLENIDKVYKSLEDKKDFKKNYNLE